MDSRQYWQDTLTLVGEIPTEKVAAKIHREFPDLTDRAALAAMFAFNVKAGLQTAESFEEDEPDEAALQRAKMLALLDVMFFMLGGTVSRGDEEADAA